MAQFQIRLTDSAWATFVARYPNSAGDALLPSTGIAPIDSLNAALGARGVRVRWPYGRTMDVLFSRPANVPALVAFYQRLSDVQYAGPTDYLGVESWMAARLHGDTVRLSLTQGWGDCLAGCMYRRNYVFIHDRRTGRVTRVSESGDPIPTAGLEAWMPRPEWAAFDGMPEQTRTAWGPVRELRVPVPTG